MSYEPAAARPPTLFVYGCRQSGTTLLSALLSQHPHVYVLNDTGVLWALNRAVTSGVERRAWRVVARTAGSGTAWSRAERSGLPDPASTVDVPLLDRFYVQLVLRYRPRASGGWLTTYGRRLDFAGLTDRARAGELTVRPLIDEVYSQLLPADRRHVAIIGAKTARERLPV